MDVTNAHRLSVGDARRNAQHLDDHRVDGRDDARLIRCDDESTHHLLPCVDDPVAHQTHDAVDMNAHLAVNVPIAHQIRDVDATDAHRLYATDPVAHRLSATDPVAHRLSATVPVAHRLYATDPVAHRVRDVVERAYPRIDLRTCLSQICPMSPSAALNCLRFHGVGPRYLSRPCADQSFVPCLDDRDLGAFATG